MRNEKEETWHRAHEDLLQVHPRTKITRGTRRSEELKKKKTKDIAVRAKKVKIKTSQARTTSSICRSV